MTAPNINAGLPRKTWFANLVTYLTQWTGGSAGQLWGKLSGSNFDMGWVDPPDGLPATGNEDDVLAVVAGSAQYQDLLTLFDDSGFIRSGTYSTATWDGMTLSSNPGRYLRIGDLVTGQLLVEVSTAGTGTSAAWLRSALPYDVRNGEDYPVTIGEYDNLTTSGHRLIGYARSNTDDIALRLCRDGSTAINLARNNVANNATLMLNFSYPTDEA